MKSRTNRKAPVLAALGAAALSVLLAAPAAAQFNANPSGVVDDWTHHHLIYSDPGTFDNAIRKGTVDRWYKIVTDPRYQMQQRRRSLGSRPMAKTGNNNLKKDWSEPMTASVAASLTGVVGTLNSSSIGSSSSLTVDGVTFDASPPTPETATIKFSTTKPANASSVTIGTVTYTFETSSITSAPSTGCEVFSAASSTGASSLYQAITLTGTQGSANYRCAGTITAANSAVTATLNTSTSTVSLTAATPGSTGFTFTSSGTTHFTTTNPAGSDGTTSGTTFAYWSGNTYASSMTVAANIATVLNANTTVKAILTASGNAAGDLLLTAKIAGVSGNGYKITTSGFSAFSPTSGSLSGGSAGVQPNAFPAKYSFNTSSASCTDFVVYPTGAPGTMNAANIVAYNNLYSGDCTTGAVPAINWAYNTGGAVTTSPILSADGSQVAYIQSNAAGASLVMLKWANSGGAPTAPISLNPQASASAYRNCPGACYFALNLGVNDTLSAPFYDYLRDALYVGDDSGNLHQFFGVFNGSPYENTTSPWPVHLGSNKLSSPVYDSETGFQAGFIFVGDMGGVFYSVGSGYGGTTSGTIYGNTGAIGDAIADAPLVDCPQGVEYVFVTTNGSYSWQGYNGVWEFVSIFTNVPPAGQPGAPGVVPVGLGGAGYYLYAGAFDNVYFQSSPPSPDTTGNLYVVGGTGTTGGAALYQVPILHSALTGASNVVASGLNSSEHPWPSPLTEFCNGACTSNGTDTTSGTDYVFFSVNRGAKSGCTNAVGNGCILAYNVNNPTSVTQAGTGYNVNAPGTNGCWATSGMVIDNLSAVQGASEIYFVNLNGSTAGGPTGATSTNCTAAAGSTVNGVQLAQSGN